MEPGTRNSTMDDDDLDRTTRERLLSDCPVVVRRRVLWGECDPAGVVYTPRFADYLAAAYGWFNRIVLSGALRAPEGGLITPMKALSLEFSHVLRPNELFDMTVGVAAIRQRTFDLVIEGRAPTGEARFAGKVTPIVCAPDFRSLSLPDPLRATLTEYQVRCANGA